MGKKEKLQKVDSEAARKELNEEELSTIGGGGGPITHRKIDACADIDKLGLNEE